MNDDIFEREVTDQGKLFFCETRVRKNRVVALCFNELFQTILFKTLVLKIPFIWDMRRRVAG
jgi:hypothetical protein